MESESDVVARHINFWLRVYLFAFFWWILIPEWVIHIFYKHTISRLDSREQAFRDAKRDYDFVEGSDEMS